MTQLHAACNCVILWQETNKKTALLGNSCAPETLRSLQVCPLYFNVIKGDFTHG